MAHRSLGEIIDTEMASSRERFSPAAREMILRIIDKVQSQGCRAKTSMQPAVSSREGIRRGKRRGKSSGFDWTRCQSEVRSTSFSLSP